MTTRAHPTIAAIDLLDLHQSRRSSAIPTLSVLVGTFEAAHETWRRWAERDRRCVLNADGDTVARHWLREWLHRQIGFSGPLARWHQKSEYEFVTSLCGPSERHHPERIRLLYRALRSRSDTERSDKPLSLEDETAMLLSLAGWVDAERLPALCVSDTSKTTAPEALIAWLYQLAADRPTLPLCLILSVPQYARLQDEQRESRDKAWVREGVIVLADASEVSIYAALAALGIDVPPWHASIHALSRLAPSPAMVEDFIATVRCIAQRPTTEGLDSAVVASEGVARSHAERLLYACLQRDPDTAGQFVLNAKLAMPFGNRAMEVDLLAPMGKLVIEVDGYYHFQSTEAYRRDRRKDLALQRHGYLVMRYLADDIVGRFESVIKTIREVLRDRIKS